MDNKQEFKFWVSAFIVTLLGVLLYVKIFISYADEPDLRDNIGYIPEVTMLPTLPFNPTTAPNIACTTDCLSREIELCNVEYDICITSKALFCNQRVGDSCEYLFSNIIE